MNGFPPEQLSLLIIQAAVLAALCVRISTMGLSRVYPWFFAYLLVAAVQSLVPSFLTLRSSRYLYVWMASETLTVCLYLFVVLETYSLILRDLAGIASTARRYIKFALALALFLSLLLLQIERTPATVPQYFLVCERAVMSGLLVFVLCSVLFLLYYPVPLNRNAVYYSVGFAVYLTIKAAALFLGNMRFHRWDREISTSLLAASTVCIVFWLFTLNRDGETRKVLLSRRWSAEDEKRVLLKMRAINESLFRTVKK